MVTYTPKDTSTCRGKKGSYAIFLKNFLTLFSLIALLFGASSFDNPPGNKKIGPTKKIMVGGDFSLDFVASAPYTYDHATGGGAFDDRTIGKTLDVVESLEGGDFKCGDIVSFLTEITVSPNATGVQTIELDYSFLAHSTGQPGRALYPIQAVYINNFTNIKDADGNVIGEGPSGSDAGNVESGSVPSTVSFVQALDGTLHVKPAKTTARVTVTGLEAGETVIVRVDVLIDCQDNSTPTGNLQADITGARVIAPSNQAGNINVGNQTVPFKNVDEIIQLSCTIPEQAPVCPGAITPFTATATVGGATYNWTITGNGVIMDGANEVTALQKIAGPTEFSTTVNVKATGTGSYTIRATITKSGTSGSYCERTVTVNQNVALTALTTPLTLCPGSNATFSTTASGTGATGSSVTWWKGATQLTDDNVNYDITVSGNVSTLTILNVNADDAGTYTAKIGGGGLCGTAERSGVLNVSTNVALTALTSPVTKCPGENASFSTTASGTNADGGDVTWWKGATQLSDDNVNYDITVSGQTSTLTILSVNADDAGTYTAKIGGGDLCGNAERSGTLNVSTNVALTALTTPLTLCPGSNATFSTTASGTGATGSSVTWWKGATQLTDDNVNYDITVSGNVSTLTILNVNADDAGTYTAKIGGGGLCGTAERSGVLNVSTNAGLVDLIPVSKCPGEDAVFTSTASGTNADGGDIQWYKGTTLIVDDNTNYDIVVSGASSTLTIHNVEEADEAIYWAKISGTGLCGSDETSAALTVVAPPSATANGGVITCLNTSVTLTATNVSPAGTTLQWYGPASGGVGPALSGNAPVVTQTGTYTLVLTEPTIGCQTTLTTTVTERFDAPLPPTINTTQPDCNTATGTITASTTTPNVTYTLTGPGGPYVNTTGVFPLLAAGTYGLSVSTNVNIPGCVFTIPLPITINPQPPCDINCTYTQGYYGNKNGNSCSEGEAFESPVELITDLLSSGDIIIGNLNAKYIRIPGGVNAHASAVIINSVMPGGGTATTLPAGTACNIVTGTCFDFNGTATAYLTKQGKINNVLLSQTIALSLNMRTNGGTLASIPIESGWLTTQDVSGCSTEAPVITCAQDASTIRSILMNQAVVNYLGTGADVADLLALANAVLAGTLTPGVGGVPSYSDINSAVDAINNAFDQCRLFLDYFSTQQMCPELLLMTNRPANNGVTEQVASDLKVAAYPNPFNSTVNFNFTAPVSGKALLEVYDLVGRRLAVVFEGQVDAGMQKAVNYKVPSAQRIPMIYRLSIGGKMSFGKLLPGNTD